MYDVSLRAKRVVFDIDASRGCSSEKCCVWIL
jgi:hypothetical protein